MRDYNRPETIEMSLKKMLEDGISIPEMRKELEAKRIDQDEIKIVIRYLDDQLIKHDQLKAQKSIGLFSIAGGCMAVFFGVFITIGSYSGFIDMGKNYLIFYGPFIIGLAGIGYGFKQINNYKYFLHRNNIVLRR